MSIVDRIRRGPVPTASPATSRQRSARVRPEQVVPILPLLVVAVVRVYALPHPAPADLRHTGLRLRRRAVLPRAIYVLVALGLNIVVGQAGLLDLGYVGFFAVGAYTVGGAAARPTALAVAAGIAADRYRRGRCLAGVLLGAPTLRLRGDYLAIVTLGLRRDHPHHRANNTRLARRVRSGISQHPAPAAVRAARPAPDVRRARRHAVLLARCWS